MTNITIVADNDYDDTQVEILSAIGQNGEQVFVTRGMAFNKGSELLMMISHPLVPDSDDFALCVDELTVLIGDAIDYAFEMVDGEAFCMSDVFQARFGCERLVTVLRRSDDVITLDGMAFPVSLFSTVAMSRKEYHTLPSVRAFIDKHLQSGTDSNALYCADMLCNR